MGPELDPEEELDEEPELLDPDVDAEPELLDVVPELLLDVDPELVPMPDDEPPVESA